MRKKMKVEVCISRNDLWNRRTKEVLLMALVVFLTGFAFASKTAAQQYYQQNYYNPQPSTNFLRNSQAFRQEIARFEITVHREGKMPMSLSQVPRVEQGDVIKVKLLDEAVNGIKLDQSLYNWTLLVAFVNPNRKFSGSGQGPVVSGQKGEGREAKGDQSSVSDEIEFRKKGWYREHSFTVPYDSQPVFFLYPRPNYRSKILGLINRNYNEIRKLGDKTIDLAGAYAQIGMFLNELQGVLSGNGYYGGGNGYGNYGNNGAYGGYNPYSSYNTYNRYNYNPYGNNPSYNYNLLVAQSVERLARSFNIDLPNNCWQSGLGYSSGSYGYGNNQNGVSPEMVGRLQCVAKSIRLEDFDLSVSRMLQQGGILLVSQLQQKYPQIAHWIGVAALAVDFIVKVFKKTPMRVVPTVTSSSDNPNPNSPNGGSYGTYNPPTYGSQGYNPSGSSQTQQMPKISLFAENQPDDNQFVTAYPLILHKWQAEPDAEVISLRPPVLMEPCLHAGVNVLKSTDLTEDQLSDNFTKDYVLTMSSTNGFKKEFPLKKNVGLAGWELSITPQDLQEFPRIQMTLESVIKGKRGFNEIKSPPFFLPIAIGGSWEITPESQKDFTVGGKRTITIKNTLGNCQCLQAVVYRPSFGGQFVFEAESGDGKNTTNQSDPSSAANRLSRLEYSPDGKEVSFEVDTTYFKAGSGEIELKTFGGESVKIPLKLYPPPPDISNLRIGKGDREGLISGSNLEQIQSVKINGRRAVIFGNQPAVSYGSTGYPPQPGYQNPANPANQPNPSLQGYVPELNFSGVNDRLVVFEDPNSKLTENTATIELILEDNRSLPINTTFPVGPSRPVLVANEAKEIEGRGTRGEGQEEKNTELPTKDKGRRTKDRAGNSTGLRPFAPSPSLTLPIDTSEISLTVQNALTDYDFRVENLSVETRLEVPPPTKPNGYSVNQGFSNPNVVGLPKVELEVLDWKNLRLIFKIPAEVGKLLGGRRLQFQIRDRERGVSDWYTIKQTFVRMPEITSIVCAKEMNGMCEMKGPSIDYISHVSVDGGQIWYPQSPGTLQVQHFQDGQKLAMTPSLQNKKLLMIRLRDFPKGEGLYIGNFNLLNTVTKPKKTDDPRNL